jgi:ElaB/YqjD/DUF883 family membrane-anchored ribosome-binding protein
MSTLSDISKTSTEAREKVSQASNDIAKEFKTFVSDIETLVKDTAHLTGDELAQAKIKLNQRINSARQYVSSMSNTVTAQAQKAATHTNELVHEKPWAAIGTGAIVSFVLGVLLGQHANSEHKTKH